MKTAVHIFSVLLLLSPQLSLGAYDWEEEESGSEREIQINRVRNYAGGADEHDLKVQKTIPNPPRSPDGVELIKRADAEPEEQPTE